MTSLMPKRNNELESALDIVEKYIRNLKNCPNAEDIPSGTIDNLRRYFKLTEQIPESIKADLLPTYLEDGYPRIEYIDIDRTSRDWVRVCLVQLDFKLSEKYPYVIKHEHKEEIRSKIMSALKIAKHEMIDIICFPELSFSKEWIDEVCAFYNCGIVICGSYYEGDKNISKIIIDGKVYDYEKCHSSILEEKVGGIGLEPGETIFVFQTEYGCVSILNCVDFDYEFKKVLDKYKVDIIVNFRCDVDKDLTFQQKANLVIDMPDGSRNQIYILHVNPKDVAFGKARGGGGTSIICYEHMLRLERYKIDGIRPNDGIKYKICEAKGEMMLMAKINIEETSSKRTEICDWYKYNGMDWELMDNFCIWQNS
jgi:predicted amidohydrolase